MKFIWKYVRPYRWFIAAVMMVKLLGTGTELLIPYVLEHLLDHVVPAADGTWREADAVTEGLAEAAQSARLWLPDEDCGYLRHGADFEQSFRAALALLG